MWLGILQLREAVREILIGTPFSHSQNLHYCLVRSVYFHDQTDFVIIHDPDLESQALNVYSLVRTSSLETIVEGQNSNYTPDSAASDLLAGTSRIPLLHKDFSHEQTFPGRSMIGRAAQNQYPSHDNQSQTRRTSTWRHPFASQFKAPDWQ